GRYVGTALIDDAHHAERNADTLDAQAIRARPLRDHAAHGIVQRDDLLDAFSHRFDALVVQHQPIDERTREVAALRILDIETIGFEDGAAALPNRSGRG